MKRVILCILIILVLMFINTACSPAAANGSETSSHIDSQVLSGADLMGSRCTVCHSLSRVTSAAKTFDEWQSTVSRMITKGAALSAEEEGVLVQYLADTYK